MAVCGAVEGGDFFFKMGDKTLCLCNNGSDPVEKETFMK
jgi:hypothetical protein